MMKCKIADCLSILVSFEKKQRIRKFIFKIYDLSLNNQYVLKGLATVFSLGSLRCEFQIFLHFIISGRVFCHVICPDLLRSYLNPGFFSGSRFCSYLAILPIKINSIG
jgi:hypothetical protein